MSMFDLSNKTALVTGAGSGIGAAVARRFRAAGAFVYVTDINLAAATKIVDELGSDGVQAIELDTSSASSCQQAFDIVRRRHPGGIHVLINNAGIGHVGTILQTAEADLDRLYGVNVRGVFLLSKLFLPDMLARRDGTIINVASIGGVVGVVDRAAYCTTKFAVVGLTKSMALDHAAANVRVNCICPARVETPFVEARIREYPDPEKAYREMSATQPIGRMARPDEIAAAAHYLASDEASFITGSEFIIDGGFSAGK